MLEKRLRKEMRTYRISMDRRVCGRLSAVDYDFSCMKGKIQMITRRSFLKTTGFTTAALLCRTESSAPPAEKPRKQPNILWIFAEDASAHIGCYGETAIKTPNLDNLAAEGIKFDNAFVT